MKTPSFDTPKKLSPEVKRALQVFTNLTKVQDAITVHGLPNRLLETGYKAASRFPFRHQAIPHTSDWTWRQSNGRLTVNMNGGQVTVTKLSPRRRVADSGQHQPSFKTWVFRMESAGAPSMWYLWVEKGDVCPRDYHFVPNLSPPGPTPLTPPAPMTSPLSHSEPDSPPMLYPHEYSLSESLPYCKSVSSAPLLGAHKTFFDPPAINALPCATFPSTTTVTSRNLSSPTPWACDDFLPGLANEHEVLQLFGLA